MSDVLGYCWSGSDFSVGDGAFTDVNLYNSTVNTSRALLTMSVQDLVSEKEFSTYITAAVRE